jgi:hypothetical protein
MLDGLTAYLTLVEIRKRLSLKLPQSLTNYCFSQLK